MASEVGGGRSAPGPDSRDATRLRIGAPVSCRDGHCGKLARVIVDPVAQALTHLVVEQWRHHLGRLVPIELVQSSGDEVRLRCTREEFERLDEAEETHFLPCDANPWGYRPGEALALPYYGLGGGGLGVGEMGVGTFGAPHPHEPIVSDVVPSGQVEVRRGDEVRAADGSVGTVQGLVIDRRDHRVTHVLLQEGHLWGRRQIAIPIAAVTRSGGVIHLTLTRQEVSDLPEVELSSGG